MAHHGRGAGALVILCSVAGLSCPALGELNASAEGTSVERTALASEQVVASEQAPEVVVPEVVVPEVVAVELVAPESASTELAPIDPLTVEVPEPAETPQAPPEPAAADETDPAPDMQAPPAAATGPDEGPTLGAIVKETWVFAKPSFGSRKIGYLRAGAVVKREPKPAGRAGCDKGWYRIAPRGYVCVGSHATIDASHAVLSAAAKRADRSRGLPYDYVMSRFPPPPLYVRLPSEEEQKVVEGDTGSRNALKAAEGLELGPIPGALLYGDPAPALRGPKHTREALLSGRPVPRSGFALLEAFEWTDRAFGLTTDMNVIPLDRARRVKASAFKGVVLEGEEGLPAAFVRGRQGRRFSFDPVTRRLRDAGPVAYREGVALTGKQMRLGGELYLEGRDGTWLRDKDNLLLIRRMQSMPGWAAKGRKWVDISLLRQTLVAYEGTRPVYATLVSTGVDGLGDPQKTHSTVQGVYQIHTKHVTSTMDGDQVGDEFDLRDVPYVQYFHEGYALHASYWHDEFGAPRSHGCVNLAPQDAAWLFAWSDPQVPEGWHGYLQPHGGAIVYTHP